MTGEIASSDISTEEALNTSTGSTEKASSDELRQVAFDQKVAEMTKRTPISDAMVETPVLRAKEHCEKGRPSVVAAKWQSIPQLQHLEMKYLCVPNTSVPYERLF